MNCRICNRECQPLFQLDNMPDRNQHLSDKPDSKGITLNVVQCKGCGLVQLDNEPVWYWKESINSMQLSKEMEEFRKSDNGYDFASFHVLEHQPNPNEYLQNMCGDINGANAIIQVPNSESMLIHDFCIDHLMYFTEDTLWTALELNGFEVVSIIHEFHDVILSAVVKRREQLEPNYDFEWQPFAHFCYKKETGIYGAGHQAFALLSILKLNDRISLIIDDNPIKQGKYTPATNIPIVGPELSLDRLDAIIVMAGGYSDEVLKKLDDFKGSVAVLRGNKLEVIR
jgi:hypothetical protein